MSAKHQSLLHFVGQAPWSDAALLARVRDWSSGQQADPDGFWPPACLLSSGPWTDQLAPIVVREDKLTQAH
ncbi:hypothetical protein NKI48_27665 [Mesorhizobium sp. M0644]|uniref:hypothetical protein n=1 Tax=Mesorhizobium sp. M0644 TaxID=2956979 RepID=UPI00333D91BB